MLKFLFTSYMLIYLFILSTYICINCTLRFPVLAHNLFYLCRELRMQTVPVI
jgi:hypothetical protein